MKTSIVLLLLEIKCKNVDHFITQIWDKGGVYFVPLPLLFEKYCGHKEKQKKYLQLFLYFPPLSSYNSCSFSLFLDREGKKVRKLRRWWNLERGKKKRDSFLTNVRTKVKLGLQGRDEKHSLYYYIVSFPCCYLFTTYQYIIQQINMDPVCLRTSYMRTQNTLSCLK